MFTTLLFDFDGTLIDSLADIATSVNHVRAHHALPPLPLDQVREAIGDGLVTLLERTVPGAGDEARRLYLAHHEAHCLDHTTVYAGIREGLTRLHGRVAMGVVSNKPQLLTERILAGLGLQPFFRAVVGGDTDAGRKPAPGPVLRALELLDRPGWDALMIGDSAADLEAGRAAATGTCAVTWGFRTLDAITRAGPADVVARSFADLLELVQPDGTNLRTVYHSLGRDAFFRLAEAFYRRIDVDPRLRAMFPRALHEPAEKQALFLIQFFGGPPDYALRRGPPRLRMRHAPFAIARRERDAWLQNMLAAIDDVGIPEPARGIMHRYFAHTATFLINNATG